MFVYARGRNARLHNWQPMRVCWENTIASLESNLGTERSHYNGDFEEASNKRKQKTTKAANRFRINFTTKKKHRKKYWTIKLF